MLAIVGGARENSLKTRWDKAVDATTISQDHVVATLSTLSSIKSAQ